MNQNICSLITVNCYDLTRENKIPYVFIHLSGSLWIYILKLFALLFKSVSYFAFLHCLYAHFIDKTHFSISAMQLYCTECT